MPTALGTVASHRSVTATAPPTTGLRAWFDADDDANILYRSPGDQIMNWTDRTHVEVMSDYYGPGPHHSGTQNGHKTVVFNGESFGGSEWMPNTDNLTMVVALKHTGAGSGAVEIIRLGAYWGYSLMARADNQNLGILCSNAAWVHTDTPSVLNAPTVLVGQRTDGTWTLHRDGVSLPITDGATATPGAPGNNESWLSPSPNLFIGEIYELLIYDKALSTTERQQVERYLATKWILVGAAKTGTAAVTYTETATAAGVAPVTGPIPTAGLVGWWDESEILANAGAVTGWQDKSGNGFHLTGTGPTTGVKTQLGHATATFNGNGNLRYDADTGLNVGAITVFVACGDRTGNSIYRGVFGAHATAGNDYDSWNAFVMETGVGWMNFTRAQAAAGFPPGLTEDPPFTVWSCELRPDGTIQPYMNGVAGTPASRAGTYGVANGGWLLGGRFEGGIPTTGSYFTGEIGEVVVYNRVLSTVERQQVDQYLMQKWVPPASYFSGGIVTDDGTWRTHKLVTSDTLTYTPGVTGPINAEYLVVAGGGGGSRGGGGAGGLLSASVTWVADQTVTVGAGGAAGNSGSHAGSGSGSSIGAVTVVGGGGGGATQDATGYNGGSGGGGGVDGGGTSVGGTGVAGTGYNGGGITTAAGHPYVSAGGGGATAVGQSLPGSSQQGGTGGAGKEWPAASGKFYAGGGGGGSWTTSPTWGVGGIGGGGNAGPTGNPGSLNTGGGGGGGGANTEQYGGVGGSGVVLVRYPHVDGMPTVNANPLTMASWHAAYWASDPDWTPPADGATAATWRDGSGNGRNMTAVGAPLYRATSTLNSKPAVEISANNGLRSAPFTAVPTPWAVFVVFKATDTAGEAHVASAGTASTWGNSFGKSGGAWTMVANNNFSGGTVTAGAHAARVAWEYLTATGSQIVVDGVVLATGGQPNNISDTATTWNIGSGKFDNQSFNWPSEVAFVGFKASPLTAHEAGNLEAWARSFYGTP